MIDVLGASAHAEWDGFVDRHARATCYHLNGWSRVAERAYGLQVTRLGSREAPGLPLRGVLPLVLVPRPLRVHLTTGLFGAYGAILADGDAAGRELVDAARALTDELGAQYLHIKSLGDEPAPRGLSRLDVWAAATLPLHGGAERVWARFKSSIRAAVRQAVRAGLTLRTGHGELESFYDVLAENMHRKGSPIYGLRFMRELLEAFGERASVMTLRAGDLPIAGALTLAYNGALSVPFASSRAAYNHLRPNNLLYWRMMERACEAGLHTFDFGSSIRGTGPLAFKLGWGASLTPVASYVYRRNGEMPRLDPSGWAVRAGVRLWQKLPRAAADALGPSICRFVG